MHCPFPGMFGGIGDTGVFSWTLLWQRSSTCPSCLHVICEAPSDFQEALHKKLDTFIIFGW